MTVNVLTLTFVNDLKPHEVPLFRGAVINALENKDVLFHNHTDDNRLRYSYPLIQYKTQRGKACLVCIGPGTDAIGEFFASGHFDVVLGDRHEHLQLQHIDPRRCNIQVWQQMFDYRIRRWTPLNSENYRSFQECDSLADRCQLLESILRGNILSMGRGLGIEFDREVKCNIKELAEPYLVNVKHVKLMGFNALFGCNVSLPSNIGLGRHASLNCGIVTAVHTKETE